jgi:hypothetical protein
MPFISNGMPEILHANISRHSFFAVNEIYYLLIVNSRKKKKMQEVSFRNVNDFLEYLPESELKVTECLRRIIFDCVPGVSEKLTYNVPFYKVYKNFVFIWPSSVLWGKKKTYEGVRLGFTNGYLMLDDARYLDKGNRKQVYCKDFRAVNDIDIDLVKSYIIEAALIDKELKIGSNGIQRKTR